MTTSKKIALLFALLHLAAHFTQEGVGGSQSGGKLPDALANQRICHPIGPSWGDGSLRVLKVFEQGIISAFPNPQRNTRIPQKSKNGLQ